MNGNWLITVGIIGFVIIDIIICILVEYITRSRKRAKERRIRNKIKTGKCLDCKFRDSSFNIYPCYACKDYKLYGDII